MKDTRTLDLGGRERERDRGIERDRGREIERDREIERERDRHHTQLL